MAKCILIMSGIPRGTNVHTVNNCTTCPTRPRFLDFSCIFCEYFSRASMKSRNRTVVKMARWAAKEYGGYSPAERRRKIRKVLGDSRSARSFLRRHMREFYEEVYGAPTTSASGRSESTHTLPLHARSH